MLKRQWVVKRRVANAWSLEWSTSYPFLNSEQSAFPQDFKFLHLMGILPMKQRLILQRYTELLFFFFFLFLLFPLSLRFPFRHSFESSKNLLIIQEGEVVCLALPVLGSSLVLAAGVNGSGTLGVNIDYANHGLCALSNDHVYTEYPPLFIVLITLFDNSPAGGQLWDKHCNIRIPNLILRGQIFPIPL